MPAMSTTVLSPGSAHSCGQRRQSGALEAGEAGGVVKGEGQRG